MIKLNYQELIKKLDQDVQKSNKNRYFIAIAALNALADDGVIGRSLVQDAIERFEIDAEKPYAPLV